MIKSFLVIVLFLSVNFSIGQNSIIIDSIDQINTYIWEEAENDLIEGLKMLKWASQKSTDINYKKGFAESQLNYGLIYILSGELEKSLANSLSANSYNYDSEFNAKSLNQLARVYIELHEFDKASECLNKSLKINLNNEYLNQIQGNYINLGNLKSALYDLDSAFIYYNLALDIAKTNKDTVGMISVLNNLGALKGMLNELTEERNYYKKAIIMAVNSNIQRPQLLFNIAYSFYLDKNYKSAEFYIESALNENKLFNSLKGQSECYQLYSLIKEDLKEYKIALFYSKEFLKYSELVLNENILKKVTKIQLENEFEQQSIIDSLRSVKRLENIKAENKRKALIQDEKLKQSYIIIGFTIVFILFAILMLTRLYKTSLARKKANIIISEQKIEVEKQRDLVEEINTEMIDSITYSKRLQNAILPTDQTIKSMFPQSFVLYLPKDIVAGDFYWFDTIVSDHNGVLEELLFFAAADCTGHGVPGAMVSVVCANSLNRCIKEFALTDPGEILDKASELVVEAFEKGEEAIYDGMDISLCVYNRAKRELMFAGANNPLIIVSKNKLDLPSELMKVIENESAILHEIKPDKQPVGLYDHRKKFTTVTIKFNSEDEIYLYSDGYADQFGGDKNKKMKSSNLKKSILENYGKPMNVQKEEFEQKFNNWKNDNEQVDDVCLIGIIPN